MAIKGWCLVTEDTEKLKQAAKNGEFDIAAMYGMTSFERRALFERHISADNAKMVNAGFEEAMVSEQQTALKNWAEKTFTASQKKTGVYQDVYKKIEDLSKLGVLNPETQSAYLEDLVTSKLGVKVTVEEAKKIADLSSKMEATASNLSEFNTPTLEYFKARRAIDDYIDSLTPSSNLRVLTEVVGRGTLLASIKSPLLNIESNSVGGFVEALGRRLQTRSIGGVNNGMVLNYVKFASQVYKETGYDVSRMQSLEGERMVRGEGKVNTQGPGKIHKLGRIYEDVIFNKTQGLPDVVFSAAASADRINIESTKIAMSEGLKGSEAKARAQEIFKDATSITPTTEQGKAVRQSAIADATYATYTNKTRTSDVALGIRKVFNIASGDLRVGDQIMPFVKTPANVIQAGLDYSGVLISPKAAMNMVKAIKAIHNGASAQEAFGDNFHGFARDMIRASIGLIFAYAFTQLFSPDDYMGEYPTTEKERRLLELNQATPNSLHIGNKWISLDYFGVFAAPIVGQMNAKKYGKDLPNTIFQYYKGVVKQSAKVPGFDEFYNTITSLKQTAPGADKTMSQEIKDIVNFGISFIRARTIPSLVSDVATGTDTKARSVDYTDATAGFKAGIPGLRETLPAKRNVLGEEIPTEGLISTLLFGARVKTAKDTPLLNELNRLSSVNNLPSITDVSKTSARAKELKNQIGEQKFANFYTDFGTAFKTKLNGLITTTSYKNASDEKKAQMMDTIKNKQFDIMLHRYNYKKPPKK